MFKTYTKLINNKLSLRSRETNKVNNFSGNNNLMNILKYNGASRNLRKTNQNFKSSLSLVPIYNKKDNQYEADNLSKRKTNFTTFNFNRAPSIHENKYKIKNIIKLKRKQRIKELDGIHNKILISESEIYRSKLYITANDFNPNIKNNLIKSNSCKQILPKNKKIQKKINNKKFFRTQKNFYTKSIDNNSIKNIDSTFLRNKQILSALTREGTLKETNDALKIMSKMRMDIIDSLQNDYSKKNLVDVEGRIVKFKIFQNIQDKKAENISVINTFIKEGYLRRLNNLKKIYQRICNKYSNEMHLYLKFLIDRLDERKEELRRQNATIFELGSQMESTIIKIIYKNKELEYLLKLRNFLLESKNKYYKEEKPELYYDLLLIRDSKIFLIGNILESFDFVKTISSKTISKFKMHLEFIKNKIINEVGNIELSQDILDSFDLGNYKLSQIFTSPEVLINIYETMTQKDLNLLYLLEETNRENKNLLHFYRDKLIRLYNNDYVKEDVKNIEDLEKLRENLAKKNALLNKKYSYYYNYNKRRNLTKYVTFKFKRNIPLYLDYNINLDTIKREKYFIEMKQYKYQGLLLLGRLINIIKDFLQLDIAKDFLENLTNRNRLYVLDIDVKTFKVENNKNTINSNIIKAISVFEDMYKYATSIFKNLKDNKKNLEKIKQQKDIIKKNKKIEKVKKEEKAKKEKDYEEMKKIYERTTKPILYIPNKIEMVDKVKKGKIKNERKKIIEKHFLEDEFNGLTKYED